MAMLLITGNVWKSNLTHMVSHGLYASFYIQMSTYRGYSNQRSILKKT